MVLINKDEKMKITEVFPDVTIVRTMKHDSKRHHYYCPEEPRIMRYLSLLRGLPAPKQTRTRRGRRGGQHRGEFRRAGDGYSEQR